MTKFVYLGKTLVLSDVQSKEVLQLVNKYFAECSDIYELIVTEKTINNIRKNSAYLEIKYCENQELQIGTFQKVTFTRLLVPLSGKFASTDQLTFFYGNPDYTSGPFVNKKGKAELSKKLEQVK